MLIEFEVGNFLSFREPVRLSMVAAAPIKEFRADNVFAAGRYRLLKSAVVYGANASGKTNLLSAFVRMRWLVLNSSRETQASEPIDVMPFKLDSDTEGKPSRFEATFLADGVRYRYGFEVDRKRVHAEWLFEAKKVAEIALFLRRQEGIDVQPGFKEGNGIEPRTRDNALFLSVVAQFNGPIATRILEWFGHLWPLHGLHDDSYAVRSVEMLQDAGLRSRIIELVRAADLGIEDMTAKEEKMDPGETLRLLSEEGRRRFLKDMEGTRVFTVSSVHGKYAGGVRVGTAVLDFDDEESDGTNKFFRLAGPLLDSLATGSVVILDELDAKLHPLLTRSIVRLFNSKETNPRNAQLIFGTHDTNLLNWQGSGGFRRDQIWFVEKNQQGATDLYSLAEFKLPTGGKVRNDAAIERNYIHGRYGAIPFIGDFAALFREEGDGKTDQVH